MPVYPNMLSFENKDMHSATTALMVYEKINGIWKVKGKVTSGGGRHAEEELKADLNGANKLGIAQGAEIMLEITKSPCHEHEDGKCCSSVLVELRTSGRIREMRIYYLGIYQSNSHNGVWRSTSGMTELWVNNIPVHQWDWKKSESPSQRTFMKNYLQDRKNLKGFQSNPEAADRFINKKVPDTYYKAIGK